MPEDLIKVSEAAKVANLTPDTIMYHVRRGTLTGYKIAGKQITYIEPGELRKFMASDAYRKGTK